MDRPDLIRTQIDLHFHCLPGIDDGPADWDEAVALCRAAADEGTTHIVATPHVLRGGWANEDRGQRRLLVAELNRRLGGRPVVLPGCEYYFSADAVDLWEQGREGPLEGLNETAHLLVEFPIRSVPRMARGVFHELVIAGVTPVLAHPERNEVLSTNLDVLADLVQVGAKVQITAGSLTGEFGRRAFAAAARILDGGLAHVVASDAHRLATRPPALAGAKVRVRDRWGEDVAEALFHANPGTICAVDEPAFRRSS